MRTLILSVALFGVSWPAAAQSRLYTSADLGKKTVAETPQVTEAELRGLQARQFVYVPDRTAPAVIVTTGKVGDGPFGAFPTPVPDRRLDGSSWLEPAWEMRSYGYAFVPFLGHRGGDGTARHPSRKR